MKKQYTVEEVLVSDNIIDLIYKDGQIEAPAQLQGKNINKPLILKSEFDKQKTAIAKLTSKDVLSKVTVSKNFEMSGLRPRDVKQRFFVDALLSEEIKVCVALGSAGTGKTTVAVAYALKHLFENQKVVHLCKPTALVGEMSETFGPVPGDVQEKYAPHTTHFKIVMQKLLGERASEYIELLLKKKQIQFTPAEFVRGCTFDNATFIVDEAQNFTWHELKSIASRMGQDTKLILIGDPYQIDRSFSLRESGIYTMLQSKAFRESPLTSCIYLTEQYRGPIPALITDIDNENNQQQEYKNRKNT